MHQLNYKNTALFEQASKLDIYDILDHFHIQHKKETHSNILCPFHMDKHSPSLRIYHDTNSFFCFGCKKGGGPVEFTKHKLGCSFTDACKYLKKHFKLKDNSLTAVFKAKTAAIKKIISINTYEIDAEEILMLKDFEEINKKIKTAPLAKKYSLEQQRDYIFGEFDILKSNLQDKLIDTDRFSNRLEVIKANLKKLIEYANKVSL